MSYDSAEMSSAFGSVIAESAVLLKMSRGAQCHFHTFAVDTTFLCPSRDHFSCICVNTVHSLRCDISRFFGTSSFDLFKCRTMSVFRSKCHRSASRIWLLCHSMHEECRLFCSKWHIMLLVAHIMTAIWAGHGDSMYTCIIFAGLVRSLRRHLCHDS